ncbi:DoxX family protein [Hymenobacter taeanensis]|uniref:DoxX family protein n=1 Tax=Hymenobacter taeanensis TaxID=2735321 RepID=A0A6M6BGH8_9BACT|nr:MULTISPECIES: DoxX family protein [Hymenobacter]QJX46968.1 DoxX family protein [Hymenobacter taeanensis]UOQ80846.1 DoxX family protein [Hymenobacter sp. 5414T-23]
MKKTTLLYWLSTGLLVALMTMSGLMNSMSTPESVAAFAHLGYPAYLSPFLGVAKLLGVIALVVPGFPRLREWAYAGFVFDLAGAMYSSIAVGDSAGTWLPISLGFLLIAISYRLNQRQTEATAFPAAVAGVPA